MAELKLWEVPIRVVELGRVVTVKAETKADALKFARNCHWEKCDDANDWIVTVAGKVCGPVVGWQD